MKLIILRGKTGSGKTTLLNALIKSFGFSSVEIDDIKREKYGTTTKFNPTEDFVEAGRRAKKFLDNGHNVAVEEAFLSINHIELFKNGLIGIDNHNVLYIRLETSYQSALKRKINVLKPETIKKQHDRVAEPIDGELIFNTENQSLDFILEQIKKHIL